MLFVYPCISRGNDRQGFHFYCPYSPCQVPPNQLSGSKVAHFLEWKLIFKQRCGCGCGFECECAECTCFFKDAFKMRMRSFIFVRMRMRMRMRSFIFERMRMRMQMQILANQCNYLLKKLVFFKILQFSHEGRRETDFKKN